jgi:hypothetical protein
VLRAVIDTNVLFAGPAQQFGFKVLRPPDFMDLLKKESQP